MKTKKREATSREEEIRRQEAFKKQLEELNSRLQKETDKSAALFAEQEQEQERSSALLSDRITNLEHSLEAATSAQGDLT
eukprot:CAMPEP_0172627246 /NCGR_PEP_ID=MMETSP1068-20121228/155241_1 /TAXON_ID=35684 /ORGANISM="Pseudopedinella elastica, Strain CCMP716" /LENGTH=79 /DNA_ID=CAMNT_0013437071 /DNA_START=12 /DNA_END=248 /DNA_ORIENTATION=-